MELSFLSFFKSALPHNFNKAFKYELMIIGVPQFEEGFSIAVRVFALGLIYLGVWGKRLVWNNAN